MPKKVETTEGVFNLNKNTSLYVDKEFMNAGEFFIKYIENGSSFKLKKSLEDRTAITIKKNHTLSPEGYTFNGFRCWNFNQCKRCFRSLLCHSNFTPTNAN